jgi:short-subunit dehydrogenase
MSNYSERGQALITGASSGIGAIYATACRAESSPRQGPLRKVK